MGREVAEWGTQDRPAVAASGDLSCLSEKPGFWRDRAGADRPKGPRQYVLELELGTRLE